MYLELRIDFFVNGHIVLMDSLSDELIVMELMKWLNVSSLMALIRTCKRVWYLYKENKNIVLNSIITTKKLKNGHATLLGDLIHSRKIKGSLEPALVFKSVLHSTEIQVKMYFRFGKPYNYRGHCNCQFINSKIFICMYLLANGEISYLSIDNLSFDRICNYFYNHDIPKRIFGAESNIVRDCNWWVNYLGNIDFDFISTYRTIIFRRNSGCIIRKNCVVYDFRMGHYRPRFASRYNCEMEIIEHIIYRFVLEHKFEKNDKEKSLFKNSRRIVVYEKNKGYIWELK